MSGSWQQDCEKEPDLSVGGPQPGRSPGAQALVSSLPAGVSLAAPVCIRIMGYAELLVGQNGRDRGDSTQRGALVAREADKSLSGR